MQIPLDIFLKPSAKAFWKAARERPGASLAEALHGLFYLKWPELYIRVGLGRSPMARKIRNTLWRAGKFLGLWAADAGLRFADTYHGKVMPLDDARRLIRVERPIDDVLPEKVLPYSLARRIILDNPMHLALLHCPCRASMPKPCLPLDVCIIVGKIFVDFVLEHHPEKSRRVSTDEAVAVVAAAQKRGHVSHAFFKEAVLGRYYAICNCCSCCCGAMQAQREGTPMLASSGYVAVLDAEHCAACGKCAPICPFKAVTPGENGGGPAIDAAACMGCGVCVAHCARKALRLERDPAKPEPLALEKRYNE